MWGCTVTYRIHSALLKTDQIWSALTHFKPGEQDHLSYLYMGKNQRSWFNTALLSGSSGPETVTRTGSLWWLWGKSGEASAITGSYVDWWKETLFCSLGSLGRYIMVSIEKSASFSLRILLWQKQAKAIHRWQVSQFLHKEDNINKRMSGRGGRTMALPQPSVFLWTFKALRKPASLSKQRWLLLHSLWWSDKLLG